MELKFFLEDLLGAGVDLITAEVLKPVIKNAIWRRLPLLRGYRLNLNNLHFHIGLNGVIYFINPRLCNGPFWEEGAGILLLY